MINVPRGLASKCGISKRILAFASQDEIDELTTLGLTLSRMNKAHREWIVETYRCSMAQRNARWHSPAGKEWQNNRRILCELRSERRGYKLELLRRYSLSLKPGLYRGSRSCWTVKKVGRYGFSGTGYRSRVRRGDLLQFVEEGVQGVCWFLLYPADNRPAQGLIGIEPKHIDAVVEAV